LEQLLVDLAAAAERPCQQFRVPRRPAARDLLQALLRTGKLVQRKRGVAPERVAVLLARTQVQLRLFEAVGRHSSDELGPACARLVAGSLGWQLVPPRFLEHSLAVANVEQCARRVVPVKECQYPEHRGLFEKHLRKVGCAVAVAAVAADVAPSFQGEHLRQLGFDLS
jgi:hypothetical protein